MPYILIQITKEKNFSLVCFSTVNGENSNYLAKNYLEKKSRRKKK